MEWVPEQPAGCEEHGVEAHWYCPVCELCFADEEGEQLVESWELSIAPTGHRFDETKWEHNDNHHWHEVTLCGHTGLQSGYADHEFEGRFCKICSYELTVPLEKDRTFIQDGLIYEWASDGYSLSGVDGDKTAKTTVIIPEEVNGFAVKYIYDRAFEGCTAINSVSVPSLEFWNEATGGGTAVSTGGFGRIPSPYTMYIDGAPLENLVIPEGTERIGDYANCISLKTVIISSGVDYSDFNNWYKFTGCTNLEKLTLSADYVASEKVWSIRSLFDANGKGVPASLKTIEITDGDKICNYFFQNLSGVENIILPDGITEIGDYAFKGCAALKNISLPDRVAKIGSEAFNGCAALAALEVPAGVSEIGEGAFIGCDTLESLSLPVVFTSFINLFEKSFAGGGMPEALKEVTLTGVLPIPDNVFKNFNKIESVNIGNGIASIGASAFKGCSSLSDITFGSGIESFGESAFEGCAFTSFTIPEKIKTIESKTFYGCSSLATVDFGSVETIKTYAFAGCAFVELEIPETVKYIGDSAFYCATLHKVNTPSLDAWLNIQFESHQANPVAQLHELYVDGTLLTDIVFTTEQTEVNDYAFFECTSITSVTFPAGFERIGQIAFFNCTSLNAVYASTLESWCAIEMGDNYILNGDGRLYIGGELVEELVVPGSISVVKNFQGCDSIKSVVVKEGANVVDDYAFAYCKSLESVVIEKGVEVIGVDAFCYCEKLKSVTTFGGLKEVKSGALSHCSSLTTVDFGADLEAIESDVFSQSTLESLSMPVIDGHIQTGVPATLKNLTVTGGTEIASFALPFPSLQTVIIPDSVTKIGKNVFGNRSNLVSIKLPFVGPGPNDTSYESNKDTLGYFFSSGIASNDNVPTSLKTVEITNTETIYSEAFKDCPSIEKIILHEGLKSIVRDAFDGCSSLKQINLPRSLESIGSYAFSGSQITCLELFENVFDITSTSFDGLSELTSITVDQNNANFSSDGGVLYNKDKTEIVFVPKAIAEVTLPSGITAIGEYAFRGCTKLETLVLNEGLETIGFNAFLNCTALPSIELPQSLKEIGNRAFENCTLLTSITIPAGVATLNESAFRGCTSLERIDVAEGNEKYTSRDGVVYTFSGFYYNNYCVPEGIKSLTVGEDCDLREGAFSGCAKLESVTFKSFAIRSRVFENCTALKEIVIFCDFGVSILTNAFSGCTALKKVYLGANISKLESEGNENYILDAKKYQYSAEYPENTAGNFWYYDNDGNIAIWFEIGD